MTLEEYFNLILDRYSKNEFTIKYFKNGNNDKELNYSHLEAQHYMMYEWYEDHWFDDYDDIFDYVFVPNDCNYDFYNTKFEDFLNFLKNIKETKQKRRIKAKIKIVGPDYPVLNNVISKLLGVNKPNLDINEGDILYFDDVTKLYSKNDFSLISKDGSHSLGLPEEYVNNNPDMFEIL